jgi:hypothetical protein
MKRNGMKRATLCEWRDEVGMPKINYFSQEILSIKAFCTTVNYSLNKPPSKHIECSSYFPTNKAEGKGHPRTGHEGPDGE